MRGEYNLRQAYLPADAIGIGIALACEGRQEGLAACRTWGVESENWPQ